MRVPLKLDIPPNDTEVESFVLDQILNKINEAAGNVAVLVDACALRHHSVQEVRDFCASTGFPVYSAPMGKSIISETHERFGGVSFGFHCYSFYKDMLDLRRSRHSTRCSEVGGIL